MSQPSPDPELMAEEERLWTEFHRLIDSLPEDKVGEPGYFAEGWFAKDLVAHIGSWLAEAGVVLERIRFGTYRPEEIDVDAMNETFYDSIHHVAFCRCARASDHDPQPDVACLALTPGALARGRSVDHQGRPRASRGTPSAAPGVGGGARPIGSLSAGPVDGI